MTTRPMTCEQFDELLPDYLPDADDAFALDAATRASADAHLASCARCTGLVADLAAITRQARALAPLRPERDLWTGIADRIAAPVVALPTGPAAAPSHRATAQQQRTTTYTFSRRWLGAAAAALVAVTAGVTYSATRIGSDATGQHAVATAPVATPARTDSADLVPPSGQLAAAPVEDTASVEPERTPTPRAGDVRTVAGQGAEPPAASVAPGAATYDREIAQLRRVLQQRRADLDSGTVAVLERNLKVIDDAIAQSRAALARDPRSRFLGQQLERTLDQKLELLRTAALLPARS